jgi:Leucine-rich repeat (LRR) protein
MGSENGEIFIKRLANYVRTHEKALANALQLQRRLSVRRGSEVIGTPRTPLGAQSQSTGASSLVTALSIPFTSQPPKPAKLSLTPHHLYYLLTRFEELNISVGPMGVRLENIHSDASPGNYVSFLRDSSTRRNRSSDSLSIHSVSSVRSVMSGVSSLWSNFGFGATSPTARQEKVKAAIDADLKYLYSSFTKVPCLRLAPDRKARLVEGYEEFPFDTAVPLLAFKNTSSLEICDIDIRQFFGWDRMAEQLRSLIVKRAGIEDPAELLIAIVLDDMDRRRRRSAKVQSSPIISYSSTIPRNSIIDVNTTSSTSTPPSPQLHSAELIQSQSAPASHYLNRVSPESPRSSTKNRQRSSSPSTSSPVTSRAQSHRMRRSGSASSYSSAASTVLPPNPTMLPPAKWRFLRHLSLADNGLHSITAAALVPLSGSLTSLDLSSNLFTSIPDCLSILTNLRALNLSDNMIDSLHSLTRSPLPAITSLNLRSNRLSSLAGIERALTLERLDLRQNQLTDPTELARLTTAPNLMEVWVASNPFTKTHSSTYRVTIFNLFRNTPGYTDDIKLDSQGPGMIEKRGLAERVGEAPAVPVVKVVKQQPVAVHQVAPLESRKKNRNEEEKRPNHTTEVARAKKKTGRRRVVELGREECALPSNDEDNQSVRTLVGSNPNSSQRSSQPVSTTKRPSIQTTEAQNLGEEASSGAESSPPPSLPNDCVDWSNRGDEFRRKVEALKNEVGSQWLSVLSEESLTSTRKPSPTSPSAIFSGNSAALEQRSA